MDKNFDKMAYAMKLKILELAHNASPNGVHVGGALSSAEILVALTSVANLSDKQDRDRIILSKGHGALALYTALWQKGFINESELAAYDSDGGVFYAHPSRDISKGIEFSGGSLGLGISYAAGQAYALKQTGGPASVYCIVGDGELDEGIVWEALMSAANFRLDNLTVIVDCNKGQLDGYVDEVMSLGNLKQKFEAFGFDTRELDGHNIEEVMSVLTRPSSNKPKAIIANTVKGNGVDFLTGTKESHYGIINDKKYAKAIEQIKKAYGYEI